MTGIPFGWRIRPCLFCPMSEQATCRSGTGPTTTDTTTIETVAVPGLTSLCPRRPRRGDRVNSRDLQDRKVRLSGAGGSVNISIPQLLWHGNTEMQLSFPATWSVSLYSMKGGSRPPLAGEEIAAAFASPVGTKTLEELAAGKGQVAILFDDLARPTPVSQLVPCVIEAIERAGVPDSRVRLIAALGAPG